jgi:ketosteroid isomerase-like protein
MTTDPRISVIESFFQRAFAGDISSATGLLDEKVRYYIPGSHSLSGQFDGAESVAKHIRNILEITNSTVDVLQWEDWLVGIDYIAALVRISTRPRGSMFTFRGIYLIEMSEENKIRRIELFLEDQAQFQRVFGAPPAAHQP